MKNSHFVKNFYIIIIAFIFLITIISSCENPNPKFGQLPPITTEGKGTFGYKVDGEVQGQCYDGLFTSLAKAEIVGDSALIITNSCNRYGFNIVQNVFNFNIIEYEVTENNSYLRYSPSGKSAYYSNINDLSNAYLEILKIDTLNKIVSGTFYGTLFDETGESVEITEGLFDLIYKEY